MMKKILRQNAIRIAIGVVVIFIITGASLSFYNRTVMENTLEVQAQTQIALAQLEQIDDNFRFMDISARGYALIRKEQFLFWTPESAQNLSRRIFAKLDSVFALQGFNDPDYAKMKQAMNHYTDVFTKMVGHLNNNETAEYLAMLEFDYGKIFYTTHTPLLDRIRAFEKRLDEEAQQRYKAATDQNRLVQIILCIVGLPVLVWVVYKITKDERGRLALLRDLEKNNKQYLFDAGTESDDDAKRILQTSIHNLQKASSFVTEISTGNYHVTWQGLTSDNAQYNTTNLAGRLLYMRDEMKRIKEEDNRRMWTTQGLSELSDIIRKHQNNLSELTYEALTFIVKYSQAQQGGLFIAKEDAENEIYLDLVACYAFDRKKFVNKKLNIGEGLVGQVFLEGQTSLLKQVPGSYLHITSGLGHAMPRCVVIVPMKNNDVVQAIAELASFEEFQPYQVAFFEKAGEFIASAIASAQHAERNKVVMEQMRAQTEQLRSQEEELRQNIEELEATQEAMRRQTMESAGVK